MIVISCSHYNMLDNFLDDLTLNKANIFKALGDPTRLSLFYLIVKYPDICACELLKKMSIAQTTLSHHLKILLQANLINVRKEGRWKHYSANLFMIDELIHYMNHLKEEK